MGDVLNFPGFAPQLSPGQSYTGGFTAPTVDDPLTSSSQTGNAGLSLGQQLASGLPGWLGGTFTPAAGSSLSGALSTLSKAGQGAGAAGEKAPGMMNIQNAQGAQGAGASRSSGAGELATLLAALDARRNLLLQSATSGQARPVANMANPAAGGATRQTTGLLGI